MNSFENTDSAILALKKLAQKELQRIEHLPQPMVRVCGPLTEGEQIAELVPHSHLYILPEIGHIPMVEDYAVFNDTLASVLLK